MKFSFLVLILFLFNIPFGMAQHSASTPRDVLRSVKEHVKEMQSSEISGYPMHSSGPVVVGGRVTDIAVNPKNHFEFYVAYASGGVFRTTNNGQSFKPIFDNQGSLTIGDIAISGADPNIIWVGTGENNSSRSSYAGVGVYKSTDGGNTWTYEGLPGTQHIGRIITHPTNPDIAWVASIGALYSHNSQRGVYKTTDGGKTWKKTLFINDSTGVIDLAINPKNPDELWAASWQRSRHAWNFVGSGVASAIYRSTDGGNTWKKSADGFPTGENVGRIGLAVSQSSPNIVYAVLDNQRKQIPKKKTGKKTKQKKKGLTSESFKKMSRRKFLALSDSSLNAFLRNNGFPDRYNARIVKKQVASGKYGPKALYDYHHNNADEDLVNTSVIGAQVYRSDDYGEHWKKMNEHHLGGLYYTYGYYFGQIRVNPENPADIYIMGVPILKSNNSGQTFKLAADDVHSDFHALWIDPSDSLHLIVGCDGGVYMSYDGGSHWTHLNNTAVAQFYSINVDNDKPFNLYGGMQDNGVFYGPWNTIPDKSPHWKRLLGGDGMHVAVNRVDDNTVYAGFQFGNYYRINRKEKKYTNIKPRHNIGEPPYRFNWNTPVIVSPHNPDIVYMGTQKLLRSVDRGNHFEEISGDLTTDRQPQGNVPYSTITTIAESPLKFGLVWAGTDDGNLWVTKDGGGHWQKVSNQFPTPDGERLWVTKVTTSPFDTSAAFVSLSGYTYDLFHSYTYKTSDYGHTWTSISGDLPQENVNVIRQDPVNPHLLFAGTDGGAYLSLDDGHNWQVFTSKFPNVPVHDMVIQRRDSMLAIGTHGRSAWVVNIAPFEEMTPERLSQYIVAFKTKKVIYNRHWGKKEYSYLKATEPSVRFEYYVGKMDPGVKKIRIEIRDRKGRTLQTLSQAAHMGFHSITWNLKINKKYASDKKYPYAETGSYPVYFMNGKDKSETILNIINPKNDHESEDIPGEED